MMTAMSAGSSPPGGQSFEAQVYPLQDTAPALLDLPMLRAVLQADLCGRDEANGDGEAMTQPTARELVDKLRCFDDETPELVDEILAARVEAVLALHTEDVWEDEVGNNDPAHTGVCGECARDWPCPTVRRLNGEDV